MNHVSIITESQLDKLNGNIARPKWELESIKKNGFKNIQLIGNFSEKIENELDGTLIHAQQLSGRLLKKSKLYGFSIFGISSGTKGFLFDTRINKNEKLAIPQTNISKLLKSQNSLSYYESLDLKNKCKVLDLIYEPNGYTIIGFTKQAYLKIANERIKQNFIKLK